MPEPFSNELQGDRTVVNIKNDRTTVV